MADTELRAAQSDHRQVPLDERHGSEPGHVRQHLGPPWRHHADLAVGDAVRLADARHDRGDAASTGEYGSWKGPLKPSTEWRFHLDIMKARPDVGGIVHTHATYSHRAGDRAQGDSGLPLHDGGFRRHECPRRRLRHDIGTKELSDHALKALENRTACLLANHGMIATGAIARQGHVARGRTRDHRPAILSLAGDRRPGAAERSRNRRNHRGVRQLRACRTPGRRPARKARKGVMPSGSGRSSRHRRRHQRRRHRARRGRPRPLGRAVREGRSGAGNEFAFRQARSMAACAISNIMSSAWCARR